MLSRGIAALEGWDLDGRITQRLIQQFWCALGNSSEGGLLGASLHSVLEKHQFRRSSLLNSNTSQQLLESRFLPGHHSQSPSPAKVLWTTALDAQQYHFIFSHDVYLTQL